MVDSSKWMLEPLGKMVQSHARYAWVAMELNIVCTVNNISAGLVNHCIKEKKFQEIINNGFDSLWHLLKKMTNLMTLDSTFSFSDSERLREEEVFVWALYKYTIKTQEICLQIWAVLGEKSLRG
jgi:hypothetical protein